MKVLIFASLLLLTACGFHPVYGVNKYEPRGVEVTLGDIGISNIPDREGQVLRNLLIDRFYRGGRPEFERYRLQVSPVHENITDLDITKTADTTRAQLRLTTTMALLDASDQRTVLQRSLQAVTSYNILSSEFATRVSEQNARENALADLARQIERQITLHLKR